MGAALVKASFVYALDVPLKPSEMLVLLLMANTSLDSDDPPRYFASRESMALALGLRLPDADPDKHSAESRQRASGLKQLQSAVRGLVDVGAIRNVRQGHRGSNAQFEIILDVPLSRTTPEFQRRAASPSKRGKVGNPNRVGLVE